jgi:hypothetical protein
MTEVGNTASLCGVRSSQRQRRYRNDGESFVRWRRLVALRSGVGGPMGGDGTVQPRTAGEAPIRRTSSGVP